MKFRKISKPNINISGKKPWKVLSSIKKIDKPIKKHWDFSFRLDKILKKINTEDINTRQIKISIKELNEDFPNSHRWKEFNIIWKKKWNILIVNNKWNFKLLEITKINSRSVLNDIKKNDCSWVFDSYDIRNSIMHIDDSVKSFEAFTKWIIPSWKYEAKDYLKDTNNWLKKRVELHNLLYNKYYDDASKMSNRLWNTNPKVILMRGNTAVWKTYTLKKMDKAILNKYPLLDKQWEPTGALNPDLIKQSIREFDRSWTVNLSNIRKQHTISDCQSHVEWSIINDRIIRKLFEEKKSLVLDKRFIDTDSIQQTVIKRMDKKYKLIIIDVWWKLKDSLKRSLKRDTYSNDPIVPYEPIEDWYIKVTTNRNDVAHMKECDEYYLFYNQKLIATSLNWKLVRNDFLIYNNLVKLDTKEQLNYLRDEYRKKINKKTKNWKLAA